MYTECQIPNETNRLQEESKTQAGDGGDSNDGPAGHLDLLVGDADAEVPCQMPQAIEAVECERQGGNELGEDLCGNGPCGKASGKTGALEVPTKRRSNEVPDAEKIERTGEGNSSDTVER